MEKNLLNPDKWPNGHGICLGILRVRGSNPRPLAITKCRKNIYFQPGYKSV